tara:strand:- start:413 stop:622 length:210 start_codon:yes stop_codon:yes gene_type:complete
VESTPEHTKGFNDLLLVGPVLGQAVVIAQFFDEGGWGLIVGDAAEDARPAFVPDLGRGEDYGTVGTTQT